MNTEIYIIIGFILLSLIGLWFIWKFYKKKIAISIAEKIIPNEITKVFNNAEQMMKGGLKEDGTTTSPYQILWELSSEHRKRKGQSDNISNTTEQPIDDRELFKQSNGGQDIQDRTTASIVENKSIIRKPKQNNFRRIINSLRRRN